MRKRRFVSRSVPIRYGRIPRIVVSALALLAAVVILFAAFSDRITWPISGASRSGTPWFQEVAGPLGVDFLHVSGHGERRLFPEIMCGGVCVLDYDNDGWMDLYFVQGGSLYDDAAGGPTNRLYRNQQGRSFEDVTDQVGVGDAGYGMGCTVGDYDADGDVDLYVTNVGANVLYRNNGNGTFTDVTSAGGTATTVAGNNSWSTSAAFLDYDGDGLLDLFVANYVHWSFGVERDCFTPDGRKDYCTPGRYVPAPDALYRNGGNGTFVDVSVNAGLGSVFGRGLGVASGDFNGDGFVDVYVANDQSENQLWVGADGGTFTDQGLIAGCAVNMNGSAEAGMGVAAVDCDDDGDLDLFVSHLRGETNTFYRNEGGVFSDATAAVGLGVPSIRFTGFGLSFADFDHDGYLDLYVANGRVALHDPSFDPNDPYAEPNLLLSSCATYRYDEVLPRGGTKETLIGTSRATALVDYDNDGAMDIIVVNKDAKAYVLHNRVGRGGAWIGFRVLNRSGCDAVGAMVGVEFGSRTVWRAVQPANGYLSSNDPRIHFGLGEHDGVDRLIVRWPDGTEDTFGPFRAGAYHVVARPRSD